MERQSNCITSVTQNNECALGYEEKISHILIYRYWSVIFLPVKTGILFSPQWWAWNSLNTSKNSRRKKYSKTSNNIHTPTLIGIYIILKNSYKSFNIYIMLLKHIWFLLKFFDKHLFWNFFFYKLKQSSNPERLDVCSVVTLM